MTYGFNPNNKPPEDLEEILDILTRVICICMGLLFIQAIFAMTAIFASPLLLGGTTAVLILAVLLYVIIK